MVNIAIKPGTTFTSIYVSGHGLVLREPTVAALDNGDKKRIRAVGQEALDMRGTAPNVTVVSPVVEGVIREAEIFTAMLKEYLERIWPDDAIFKPRYKAIVSIPLGLTVAEREMYEEVFTDAGINAVTFVPSIVLSAIGADLPVGLGKGMLAVNIGGGRTEAALMSYGGIINGYGMGLGGNLLDKAIVDCITGKYNVKISLAAAKKLREEIGTLYDNDIATARVSGMNIASNVPEDVCVYALDIRDVILPYFLRICELIKTIIKRCPAGIANGLLDNGIVVTGGVSNIPGIDALFMEKIGLPVKVFVRPEYIEIIGAGKLINNDDLMQRLIDGGSV